MFFIKILDNRNSYDIKKSTMRNIFWDLLRCLPAFIIYPLILNGSEAFVKDDYALLYQILNDAWLIILVSVVATKMEISPSWFKR